MRYPEPALLFGFVAGMDDVLRGTSVTLSQRQGDLRWAAVGYGGQYVFKSVRPGTAEISISRDPVSIVLAAGEEKRVDLVSQQRRITGHVRHADTGEPIRRGHLFAMEPTDEYYEGSYHTTYAIKHDGSFAIDNVAPGTCTLCVFAPNAALHEEIVTVATGERELRVDLNLSQGGTIEGAVVLEGRTIDPQTLVTLRLYDERHRLWKLDRAWGASPQHYQLTGVPEGDWWVEARADGWTRSADRVHVRDGETTRHDFTLRPQIALRLLPSDEHGDDPERSYSCDVTWRQADSPFRWSEDTARWEVVPGLSPQRYDFTVSNEGGRAEFSVDLSDVAPGQMVERRVQLLPDGAESK